MSYVTAANVAEITGIALGSLKTTLINITDRHVENLVGFDMDSGAISDTQKYDIERRNAFYVNYDGQWDFVLRYKPVIEITSVTLDPDGTPTVLDAAGDPPEYWLDSTTSIVKIRNDINMSIGQNKLKIIYTYGYASIPNDVKDYADMYCSMMQELKVPLSDGGYALKEYEMGRYRELYDVSGSAIKMKYSVLESMKKDIENKYKIWE